MKETTKENVRAVVGLIGIFVAIGFIAFALVMGFVKTREEYKRPCAVIHVVDGVTRVHFMDDGKAWLGDRNGVLNYSVDGMRVVASAGTWTKITAATTNELFANDTVKKALEKQE